MLEVRGQRYHGGTVPNSRRRAAWWAAVCAALAIAWVRWRPFRVAVHGDSMAQTLMPGDFLLAVRPGRVRRGTLVVAERPDRPGLEIVKRVAAGPGETVGGRTLEPGEYWLLGDRPDRSTDSRTFGPVGSRHLRGVVVARYWPPRRAAML
jgi:type IV secretory pathway protease TraF